ncbi:MAG: orotidine-5'-phosphate decarboxylase [Desulfobacterales bacterium]|nr:orotidine-5'-phosphate decarboxylase [Desulfobacterales bacterium]
MKVAKDYLVFPLDVPTIDDASRYVELLRDSVGIFKVGLELFIKAGPGIVHEIRKISANARIFLDLKLHDIPETVYRAMQGIASLGITYATVHCGESKKMLEAAVKGADGKVHLLGVTVLTSVAKDDIRSAGYADTFADDVSRLVLKRAAMAKNAGFTGVICSGHEARQIKDTCGETFLAVTPGIRPTWDILKSDDQARIMTPARAIRNGSDHLVIGRPIRDAVNPAHAARQVLEEIENTVKQQL